MNENEQKDGENVTVDSIAVKNVVHRGRQRRWLRFGLLDLMLLTLVVGAWLPTYIAWQRIPALRNDVERMRAMTDHLPVLDKSKLCIRELPAIWHQLDGWKYYLPENASMELRLATEEINSLGDPSDYEVAALPAGIHTIHLKHVGLPKGGNATTLYIDGEAVIKREHPPGWNQSGGGTSTSSVSSGTTVHAIDETLVLQQMEYSFSNPKQNNSWVSLPDGYDARGNRLWIAPSDQPPRITPTFVSPEKVSYPDRWGHRQGVRIGVGGHTMFKGLLTIEPDARLALNDARSFGHRNVVAGLSVRPITASVSGGEAPESVPISRRRPATGLMIEIHDALDPDRNNTSPDTGKDPMTDDETRMRAFAHYDFFPSGAKPIIELVFDVDHPNRVGFLVHQADDSVPIDAVELVAVFGHLPQWRRVELLPSADDLVSRPDSKDVGVRVELQTLSPHDDPTSRWIKVPFDRLPEVKNEDGQVAAKKVQITSDVEDYSKVTYPLGTPEAWKYDGLRLKQTWYVPDNAEGVSVRLRGSAVYPSSSVNVPGGLVIADVGVMLPLSLTTPVWLEIDSAEPSLDDS